MMKTPRRYSATLLDNAETNASDSDWWFASTAIPLIAATFAPMANVISIAALVVSWRDQLTETGPLAEDNAVDIPDPHWYYSIQISLVYGCADKLLSGASHSTSRP